MTQYALGTQAPTQGLLQAVSIPFLLRDFYTRRACGVLRFSQGDKQKAIQLAEGYPLAVWSNLIRERLDRLLIKSGRLDADAAERARESAAASGNRFGETLLALEAIGAAQLDDALREQAEEKLLEVFSWEEGRYRFIPNFTLRRSTQIAQIASPANYILRGVLERTPTAPIERYWSRIASATLFVDSNPYEQFHDIEIGPIETSLLEACKQGLQVHELLKLGEEPLRLAYALVQCGILDARNLEVEPEPERGASAEASEMPPSPLVQVEPTLPTWLQTREEALAPVEEEDTETDLETKRVLSAEHAFQKGLRFLKLHRWKPAHEAFKEAVSIYQEEGEYHSYFAFCDTLVHGQRPEVLKRALRHAKIGAKLAPKSGNTWLQLARIFRFQGRNEESERAYLRALQCDARLPDAERELRALMESRKPRGVRGLLNRIGA